MKERPILFSGPMVRAILSGSKTQTRRIVNMDRLQVETRGVVRGDWIWAGRRAAGRCKGSMNGIGAVCARAKDGEILGVKPGEFDFVCPYCDGTTSLVDETWTITPAPEQKLWIKEAFDFGGIEGRGVALIRYKADAKVLGVRLDARDLAIVSKWKVPRPGGWRGMPGMYLLKSMSRPWLDVASVRMERLQDISEEDSQAEGAEKECRETPEEVAAVRYGPGGTDNGYFAESYFSYGYRRIWEEINGANSWAANPWVWVITFRRVQ